MFESKLDGQQIAKLCKNLLPEETDHSLLEKLQALAPSQKLHLARTGDEWYNIGGIVDASGKRISSDLIEWTERTYLECGQNLQTFIAHVEDENLIATKITGKTLYFILQTGDRAEDFIQIEIDKTHEVSDRLLINHDFPPEDLEDFIDPLDPKLIQSFCIGTGRYAYRRKTDVRIFMEEINKYHLDEHPVQRFMDDWNRSSAGQKFRFSDDWILRPYQHTGRFGEQVINVDIVNTQKKNLPILENVAGKQGSTLNNLLGRFDRQAGYPFAWFFYMLKGKLVSPHSGEAVFKDISGDFAYLPERDIAVLKDWISTPYAV